MLRHVIELTPTTEPAMSATTVFNQPYANFCAELAEVEARIAQEAKTWEQAMNMIPLLREVWDRHGFYGAWRGNLDEAIQRIDALGLPVEAPDYWPWEMPA